MSIRLPRRPLPLPVRPRPSAPKAAPPPPPRPEPASADVFVPKANRGSTSLAVTTPLGGADRGVTGKLTLGPTAGGASLTVEGGFSTELKGAKGYGVSFGVDASASVVTDLQTEDGVTTFSVEADASVTLTGGVETPKAGLSVGYTAGLRGSYSVAMPEAMAAVVDPKTVNPYEPDSMPTGTVISMSGERYQGTAFEATFQHIALSTNVETASGVSVVVEKTGADTARVTAGPTEAIDAYNSVGLDFGVASASIGRDDSLKSATLKTAEFDLSTPEGRAAYNEFLTTGALPAENGPGVSGAATIEKLDFESQTKFEASLLGLKLSVAGQANTGAMVVTTCPDGSKDVTTDLRYGDNVPMQLTRHFDAEGNEVMDQRRYAYTITADSNTAQLLNVALTGDVGQADSGPVEPGKTVVLTFTEAQMQEYMEMAQRTSEASFDGSTEDFALALARHNGGSDYGTATRMFTIADGSDGDWGGGFTAIPASVTVLD